MRQDKTVIECLEDGPWYGKYVKVYGRADRTGGQTDHYVEWADNLEDARVWDALEGIPDLGLAVRLRKVEVKMYPVRVVATIAIPLVVQTEALSQEHAEAQVKERMKYDSLVLEYLGRDWEYLSDEHGAEVVEQEVVDEC